LALIRTSYRAQFIVLWFGGIGNGETSVQALLTSVKLTYLIFDASVDEGDIDTDFIVGMLGIKNGCPG